MPDDVSAFIINNGYLAIFFLVFIQEMGIPNPVPNELILVFSGYLSSKGLLNLPLILLTATAADILGTNILYSIFYFFGPRLISHLPRWWPVSKKKIETFTHRIEGRGWWTIFVCRLIPFVRGYTSIIIGLLQIKPRIFIPITIISGSIWSLTCVTTGRLLGHYWNKAGSYLENLEFIILTVLLVVLILIAIRYFRKWMARRVK